MKAYPEPVVGTLIVNEEGKILLVKSFKWNGYSIPGGHVELGETIENAVKHEVKEEVGLDVELIKILFVQEAIYPEEFHKKKHFIFLECVCRAMSDEVELDGREMQEFMWIEPEKALNLNLERFTRKFIEKYLEDKRSG